MLDVSTKTLLALVRERALPFVMIGRVRKFAVTDLERLRQMRQRSGVRYAEAFGPPAPVLPDLFHDGSILPMRSRARAGAQIRGIPFALTEDDIRAIVIRSRGRCEVSGIEFSYAQVSGRSLWAPSIDRIDSQLGYTPENCRLVCYVVNIALGHWGDAVLLQIARALVAKADKP